MTDKVLGRVTWNVGFVFIQYLSVGLSGSPFFDRKSKFGDILRESLLRKLVFNFTLNFIYSSFNFFSICSLHVTWNSHSFLVNYRTQTFRVRLRNSPSPSLFSRYLSTRNFRPFDKSLGSFLRQRIFRHGRGANLRIFNSKSSTSLRTKDYFFAKEMEDNFPKISFQLLPKSDDLIINNTNNQDPSASFLFITVQFSREK